jgi:hypothetical protein
MKAGQVRIDGAPETLGLYGALSAPVATLICTAGINMILSAQTANTVMEGENRSTIPIKPKGSDIKTRQSGLILDCRL